MTNVFDYIYLRVHNFAIGRDGTPASYASGILSAIQAMTVYTTVVCIELIFSKDLSMYYDNTILIPFVIVVIVFNLIRYFSPSRIEKLKSKWADEKPKDKRKRGLAIVLFAMFVILFPVIVGIAENNF